MKTRLSHSTKTRKKLKIEIPAEEVNNAFSGAHDLIRKRVNIKGFRKGKAPDNILDKYYKSELDRESLQILVRDTFSEALKEHGLKPVIEPRFDLSPLEKGENYSYEVELEVKPDFEAAPYLEIPLKKLKADISDDDVEKELFRIREARAELKPAPDSAVFAEGLVGSIDFDGTIDGKPFEGGSAKDYLLEYGKGIFLKEFEQQLGGIKKGETKEVNIVFPSDYHSADLQNKKAVFKVTLKALHVKELPNPDDEFAKDMGKENMEVVKKEIMDLLTKRKEREFRNIYAGEIMNYLAQKNSFEIPEGLMQKAMATGNNRKKEDVERSIKLEFVFDKIAGKESIVVMPQEIEEHFHQLSHIHKQTVADIKKYYLQNHLVDQLVDRLRMEKTLDFLISKSKLE